MTAENNARHPTDGWPVLPFDDARSFEDWLDGHHREEPGLWVKFAKKGHGIGSVTLPEALEVAMCFGWVDSKMKSYDVDYYVLRYQPRRPGSHWSPRNQAVAERLIEEGRMRPAGISEVQAAKADGRWDHAK